MGDCNGLAILSQNMPSEGKISRLDENTSFPEMKPAIKYQSAFCQIGWKMQYEIMISLYSESTENWFCIFTEGKHLRFNNGFEHEASI